jgi:hexosaminidase
VLLAKRSFYAIQSLKNLFPVAVWKNSVEKIQIPCLKVEDAPRFGFRSLMLDVARNFQKPAELKRVLDLMSTYKLNVLHLHFIDDEGWRLEINGLPELTTVGANRGHSLDSKNFLPASFGAGPNVGQSSGSGFYSRAEFIDILKYATERHIQIIPEVESLDTLVLLSRLWTLDMKNIKPKEIWKKPKNIGFVTQMTSLNIVLLNFGRTMLFV